MAQFGQSARLGAVRSQVRILLPRVSQKVRKAGKPCKMDVSAIFIF